MAGVAGAVAAIRAGGAVILPMDTVYGLCAAAGAEEAVRNLYRLKQRPAAEPMAIVAPDLERLLAAVPELRGRAGDLAAALLPAPLTLVLPNPSRRFPWLTGAAPDRIGVRIPALEGDTWAVLDEAGVVAATSANDRGGPEPRALEDVPAAVRAACEAVLDGGELPGVASTVLDLAGDEPRVLREGAVPAAEALARARAALR